MEEVLVKVIWDSHSRECGNPQIGDTVRQMDPRLRGGDFYTLRLPEFFEKLLGGEAHRNGCSNLRICARISVER